ncbi:THUMP-like domain-containing protein [Nocardioides sp. zg-1228]|uniref:class I SAM-dependent methyltransferase n=1 Tax=Nocardioides sp. zg-1228 TaxID=2763008 RepID=UPI00164286A7|nr:methyltransferase domain-containing protein [Nocardioides sp. zg-1228]MBC2934787.1 methyltransferase domain-containing protein [Nocardioides sp. zg-1228]QSF58422.1 methyltransferase domain-containing protein [Nocardioides sp. zg-1228]
MEIETLDWLRTPDGARLLAAATQAWADHPGDPVRVAGVVRRLEPDPERAAAATTQAQLRERAVAKFGDAAHHMFFTPDALEQATRARVADHRAARLAAAIPGGSVVDLGCGIGGDLLAFARAGLVAGGIDQDPVRVAMARANLEALGLPGAVQVGDATAIDPRAFDVAFADPARRGGRGRVFDVEGWTPPWSWVLDLLQRRALVKVAPGIGHDLVPAGVEAEWVSDAGDVKEAALWSPDLATTRRRATVIADGGLASLTDEDSPADGEAGTEVREVGAFLYEPDGAVIRAGLVTAVAAGVGGGLVDRHIAYVTSDASFHTPFARSYRVVEHLPYREKPLRAALQERGVGRLTIKKRGVQVVPEELRKRLALKGDNEATLVLTRVSGQGTALLVQPF